MQVVEGGIRRDRGGRRVRRLRGRGALSADDRCRVLLLEAGPDYPAAADLPADIADGSMPATSHDWGFLAEPDEHGRSVPLPRGRLMGGCSATNACFALRGWPQDYDRWAAVNPGWSFADLLPVFRAIESDADFGGDWHGSDAPVPVRRPSAGELSTRQDILSPSRRNDRLADTLAPPRLPWTGFVRSVIQDQYR